MNPEILELTITDNTLKILIFSDTHLTRRFEQTRYDLLSKIIDSSNLVIINGDLWDDWGCSFDEFINSRWKALFPKLLEKNAIYIHGNHDSLESCNHNTKLFSKRTCPSCRVVTPTLTFKIEHGHRLLDGKRLPLIEIYASAIDKMEGLFFSKMLKKFLYTLGQGIISIFGNKVFSANNTFKKANNFMKVENTDEFLICADTHYPELDLDKKYGNTGAIMSGFISYIVIENGVPSLHKIYYDSRK